MPTKEQAVDAKNSSNPRQDNHADLHMQIFLLPAILVATIAFLMNLLQLISLCRRLPNPQNHMPRILLAFLGICSSIPPFWYVAVISWQNQSKSSFLQSRDLCFLIPSGFLLFSLLGMGAVFNYEALEEHFRSAKLKPSATRNFSLSMTGFAALLSMLPSCGWNSWKGYCCLPHVWSRGFALFITIIFFLHVIFNMLILIKRIIIKYKLQSMVSPSVPPNNLNEGVSEGVSYRKTLYIMEIVPLILYFATGAPVIIYSGNVKTDGTTPFSHKCVADLSMTLSVLMFTAFAAFLPIWNMITNSNIRKTTLAVFKPLWNIFPEEEHRKDTLRTIYGKIICRKTATQVQREERGTQMQENST